MKHLLNFRYKKVINTANEYEYDLLESEFKDIDDILKEGEGALTWKQDVSDYIEKVKSLMKDLESRHQKAMDNFESIEQIGDTWSVPLFDRRESKAENLLDLDNKSDKVNKRYALISANGEAIQQLINVKKIVKFQTLRK